MIDSQQLLKTIDRYGAHNYHPLPVVLSRGEGSTVWDVEGKSYLDFLSCYSALNFGHQHPGLVSSLIEQGHKLALCARAYHSEQLCLVSQELADLVSLDQVLPMNSGAEAVETALKLARKWAYQVKGVPRHEAEMILASGNFHGRTVSIISFSTEPSYRDDFGPFTPGFKIVEYGDAKAIEHAITPNTAAVMLEPIQGEAGVVVPPEGYLKQVAEICKKNNVLFIADEIQTGLGRTGRLFASEYEGIKPDVTIVGKALSGGFYPVSAVLASKELLGLFNPGEHGSTFGGSPLAAAVARAALKVIRDENLVENAAKMGEYFKEQLEEIPSPHVKLVRGKGLLIGVVLKPEARGARRFCEALQQKGILAKETHEHVIRFAPPLIIQKETLDWALPIIREVLMMP